jgi:hypothetical protein
MPIKPENRARYPKDWHAISTRIKQRAGWRCEGSPAYPDCRAAHGQPHPVTGSRVVLTCAHLDHTPENCDPKNLRAWCQRCHLTYDAEHHAREAGMTRREKLAARFAEFRRRQDRNAKRRARYAAQRKEAQACAETAISAPPPRCLDIGATEPSTYACQQHGLGSSTATA